MREDERYDLGVFSSWDEAILKCKGIGDDDVHRAPFTHQLPSYLRWTAYIGGQQEAPLPKEGKREHANEGRLAIEGQNKFRGMRLRDHLELRRTHAQLPRCFARILGHHHRLRERRRCVISSEERSRTRPKPGRTSADQLPRRPRAQSVCRRALCRLRRIQLGDATVQNTQ
jgi:hypothetical protein